MGALLMAINQNQINPVLDHILHRLLSFEPIPKHLARKTNIFTKIDEDGDRLLSRDEVHAYLKSTGVQVIIIQYFFKQQVLLSLKSCYIFQGPEPKLLINWLRIKKSVYQNC